ncbi:MAG: hypothetical protein ACXWVS_06575 [Hyphomicrobium sp.]
MIALFAHAAAALAAALAFLSAASANPAAAQPPLVCAAGTLGTTACLGSKLCACTYDRGGIASGIPAGYRWDCGILRPGCGSSVQPPATLNPYEGPYPQALSIDRSRRSITDQHTKSGPKVGPKNDIGSKRPPEHRAPARIGAPLPLLPPD